MPSTPLAARPADVTPSPQAQPGPSAPEEEEAERWDGMS